MIERPDEEKMENGRRWETERVEEQKKGNKSKGSEK